MKEDESSTARFVTDKADFSKLSWNEKEESSFETNEETIVIPEDINKKNKKDMKDYINDLQNNGDEEEEEEEDDDEK